MVIAHTFVHLASPNPPSNIIITYDDTINSSRVNISWSANNKCPVRYYVEANGSRYGPIQTESYSILYNISKMEQTINVSANSNETGKNSTKRQSPIFTVNGIWL